MASTSTDFNYDEVFQELKPRKIQRFGWKPPLPNPKKRMYANFHTVRTNNPPVVDLSLSPFCPKPLDQLDLGSCTSNALAGLGQFLQKKQKVHEFLPSRLFIYYNERVLENSVDQDSGASLSDGITVVKTLGFAPDSLWFYNTKKFAVKPNRGVYAAAKKCLASDAYSIDNTNLDAIRTCITDQYPVVFGFTVFEEFESRSVMDTGLVPIPTKSSQVLGGHAVMLIGFNDNTKKFRVRNSWGADFGVHGDFFIDYDYLCNEDLAGDFWTIRNLIAT